MRIASAANDFDEYLVGVGRRNWRFNDLNVSTRMDDGFFHDGIGLGNLYVNSCRATVVLHEFNIGSPRTVFRQADIFGTVGGGVGGRGREAASPKARPRVGGRVASRSELVEKGLSEEMSRVIVQN